MRGLGGHGDLVVEAGAYRFAPSETCIEFGTRKVCEWTPLTAALVKDGLQLPTLLYDPFPADNNTMEKIVDGNGHNSGYLTFVEQMGYRINASGTGHIFFGYELQALQSADGGKVRLMLQGPEGPSEIVAGAVLLNLPQQPLMRVLSASEPRSTFSPPLPLFAPVVREITKLYVYYEDAWWRNYLNHTGGKFDNINATAPPAGASSMSFHGFQFPAPLQGRYFDGDYRCDGPASRPCRGFLEAVYTGDADVVSFYRPYVLNREHAPVRILEASDPVSALLLNIVHRSLVERHKDELQAVGKFELVNSTLPSSAVLSLWGPAARGFESGCHFLKDPLGKDSEDPSDVPIFHNSSKERGRYYVQPLGTEVPVYLANEAFGWPSCWAESSLVMSENVLQRMTNMSKPTWLPEPIYKHILFDEPATLSGTKGDSTSGGDPFLLQAAVHRAERATSAQACKIEKPLAADLVV